MTSRHHKMAIMAIKTKENANNLYLFLLIILISPIGNDIIVNPDNKGQGENSTRWKGCEAL